LNSNRIPQRTTVPTITRWKMRVTTTYNGVDEVVEKKRRNFVFYVPISVACHVLPEPLFGSFHILYQTHFEDGV
jgi:hypothetical protein